ncbi:hypothetical protein TWF694_001271 [Orbilia ellipsospora]|uniref:Uncharacterized protein n=1 Tax=Orbilia ellipsospora TaxID=2528407 RepID=A0AAV9XRB4_9PEZI
MGIQLFEETELHLRHRPQFSDGEHIRIVKQAMRILGKGAFKDAILDTKSIMSVIKNDSKFAAACRDSQTLQVYIPWITVENPYDISIPFSIKTMENWCVVMEFASMLNGGKKWSKYLDGIIKCEALTLVIEEVQARLPGISGFLLRSP